MKVLKLSALTIIILGLVSCSSFKAERVDGETSDKKAMEITDEWVAKDTEIAIKNVLQQLQTHRGFRKWLQRYRGGEPKVFVAEVQNRTANAYFPIDDLNDEFLTEISNSGDFILVDEAARNDLLKEITYQNDGMVDPATAKRVGKQIGADLMIFGSVYMKPKTRDGKTIKEYSVNLRMTDIERGVEVWRARTKLNKYSKNSSFGW